MKQIQGGTDAGFLTEILLLWQYCPAISEHGPGLGINGASDPDSQFYSENEKIVIFDLVILDLNIVSCLEDSICKQTIYYVWKYCN